MVGINSVFTKGRFNVESGRRIAFFDDSASWKLDDTVNTGREDHDTTLVTASTSFVEVFDWGNFKVSNLKSGLSSEFKVKWTAFLDATGAGFAKARLYEDEVPHTPELTEPGPATGDTYTETYDITATSGEFNLKTYLVSQSGNNSQIKDQVLEFQNLMDETFIESTAIGTQLQTYLKSILLPAGASVKVNESLTGVLDGGSDGKIIDYSSSPLKFKSIRVLSGLPTFTIALVKD